MFLHRARSNVQLASYFGVGSPARNKIEDLRLPLGQTEALELLARDDRGLALEASHRTKISPHLQTNVPLEWSLAFTVGTDVEGGSRLATRYWAPVPNDYRDPGAPGTR
jgi:hypothetical protein